MDLIQSRLILPVNALPRPMPVFAYQSKIRAVADHGSLTLTVRHRIRAGKTPETVNKSRLPNGVDILLASNLVITISGIYDGAQVPAEDITSSSLAEHLVEYLQTVLSRVIQVMTFSKGNPIRMPPTWD